jgi:hypothetical protein
MIMVGNILEACIERQEVEYEKVDEEEDRAPSSSRSIRQYTVAATAPKTSF